MKKIYNEHYVSLEIAKLLKEAGFDWETEFGQHIWDRDIRLEHNINFNSGKYLVSLPTLEVAQRWLREVKEIHISIDFTFITNEYIVSIHWCTNDNSKTPFENEHTYVIRTTFKTYELALEAGIKKVLEIILEKGE